MKRKFIQKIIVFVGAILIVLGFSSTVLADTYTTDIPIVVNKTYNGMTNIINSSETEIKRYTINLTSYARVYAEFISDDGFLYARLIDGSTGKELALYSPKTYGEVWYSKGFDLSVGTYYFEVERKVNSSVQLNYSFTIHSTMYGLDIAKEDYSCDLALNKNYTQSRYIDDYSKTSFKRTFAVLEDGIVDIEFINNSNGYGDITIFTASGVPISSESYMPNGKATLKNNYLTKGNYYVQIENVFTGIVFQYDICINHNKAMILDHINNDKSEKIYVGDAKKFYFENVIFEGATWKSSNTSVVSISGFGVATAIKEGTAVISLVSSDNNVIYTYNLIVVTKDNYTIQKLSFNIANKLLNSGDQFNLKPIYLPADVTNKNLYWETTDKDVATVSQGGIVTAIGSGTAIITVTDKITGKVAACEVFIDTQGTDLERIIINEGEYYIEHGDEIQLEAKPYPSGALLGDIIWYSADPSIVTVNSDGIAEGVAPGDATIIAYTAKNLDSGESMAYCTVHVENVYFVEKVSLNLTKKTLQRGKTFTLKATVSPSNAGIKTVSYKSSNTKVATVNSKGVVTGIKPGTAVITVKSNDKFGKSTKCTVTVK